MKITSALSLFLVISLPLLVVAQKHDSLRAVLDTVRGEQKVKTLNELFRENLYHDPVKALGYSREALNLATEIEDKRGMAASYNNLGVAYRNQGALDKALEYYITSLKIYESLKNQEGVATTKNNIANIYSMKKDYGQAMRYLEDSYAIFSKLGDQNKVIGTMNNLGNLYNDIQLFEKAHKYLSEAYQLSEKNGVKYADPLNNIGNIYFKQGNYDKAIEQYEKALAIEKDQGSRLGLLNVITNLGIAYTKAKNSTFAETYLAQAVLLCKELHAFTSLPAIYKASAENYFNQGKMKEAYEMLLKYDDEREKIYGEQSSRNIAQMEMVLDFQEKERELEVLKKESEIQRLELRNSRLFIVMVILGVFFVLAIINLLYRDRKRKLISP
ncbi:tetratricopeptide repeat protein [Chryseosolibacter indicus]|uniref:Tetratricopeptide repeat protein n=1 Tax=Chryseosolibacter indicus TaxID=2782351 RepID=A0ABS5VNE2_9BACT|nr:tetratricopeptide repeat protein [Chryseosolibacter indicus]MBT1702274.1 tetratricopeptide repeat protein [Chryseosolibacter indicus]